MQSATKAYKEHLKKPFRKNESIQVFIGVINQSAQRTAHPAEPKKLADWSASAMDECSDGLTYATPEEKYTKVDGSMAFLPRDKNRIAYRNAFTAKEIGQSILFEFDGEEPDIRGLTIHFGSSFPSEFTVSNGQYEYTYTNELEKWTTEDLFMQSSYIKITPTKMKNGQNRLRIYEIKFGTGVVFTNHDVTSFSCTEFISPITESVPSQDITFRVENYDLAYSVDNSRSILHFLEKGQEVRVFFGQALEDGSVEWLKGMTARLTAWSSNDKEASFTATDILSAYGSVYYRGIYRPEGMTAYELGIDIFSDMGCESYYLDPYLKNIRIRNPMPAVLHIEALQILANACRCVFSVDRDGTVCIQSSFVPDMEAGSADAAEFSRTADILDGKDREWYGIPAEGFTTVGTNAEMYFLPRTAVYTKNTGYMSAAAADDNGDFLSNPQITIQLDASFHCYGMEIDFHSVKPEQFIIHTFFNGVPADKKIITDIDMKTIISDEFHPFDKMQIEFTKGSPNSRIAVDHISFEDITDYELTYDNDLTSLPKASMQEKLKSISIMQTVYSETGEAEKTITDGNAYVSPEQNTCEVYFSKPSYGLSVISKTEGIDCRIKEYGSYFALLEFSGIETETYVEFSVTGKEYITSETRFVKNHNRTGADYTWNNPLIDNELMAAELEKWLAVYYDSAVDYQVSYRGDPRIDADDLLYLELKDRSTALVKNYQHKLDFSGSWSGSMKAAKVRNVYRTWDDVKSDYTWNTLYAGGITWSKLKARI